MNLYFIHAEVLRGDVSRTKMCGTVRAETGEAAFSWFMSTETTKAYIEMGLDVIIDKLEKIE